MPPNLAGILYVCARGASLTICSLRRDLKTALHSQGREAVRFDSAMDCRPERRLLLSWEQRTAICTPQSAYILASPVAPPLTFPPRMSPCDKAEGQMTG
jgi:hypothetical protein